MNLVKLTAITMALVWLSACTTFGGSKDSEGETVSGGDVVVEDRSANSSGVEGEGNVSGTDIDGTEIRVIAGDDQYQGSDLLDGSSPLLANRVVYFEYDSSAVRQEDVATLEAHATYLGNHINVTVRLIGHTDERGSREYNLALGERRALAIRQILMLQGASIKQVEVTSFGEERPDVEGSDESAWQQNRRVELIYAGS